MAWYYSDLAARHARLRFRANAGAGGRHVQRQNAEAGADRGAQRLLLHAGSRHRRAPGDQQVRTADELGQRSEQVRRPAARSRQRMRRSPARWCRRPPTAPSTGSRRPILPDTGLFYVAEGNGYSIFYLTDVDPRGSMGLGGKEEVERRVGRQFSDRDRLQDGEGRLEASLLRQRRRRRIVDHRREAAVCGRWRGQPGGARCGHRQAAVEHAHRRRHQCAADVHAGWPSIRDRGHGRYAVGIRAVLRSKLSPRPWSFCQFRRYVHSEERI